ncbi:uncharacterized protein EDB91DRAFT_632249 [Suillus paluster]|uniref:uncharacterized protein n=1 Tax=Suillus paluster TaxID=48578 RepID=UPI001B87C555|nr:uncharacterized protein EDB91DRAFT_632249 [Suillus paluster]KAG1733602.1 hypothetical protein EDB91DRAFT_632249 [Suillus paluster]
MVVLYLARTHRYISSSLLTSNMTLVSDDPSYWPLINLYRLSSYFVVASFAAVVYDWALTFGEEVELVWRQRWSHVTLLYLGVRHAAIPYVASVMLISLPSVSVTDAVSHVMYVTLSWTSLAITTMLSVIVTIRLHVMYRRSRRMLIFLIVIFLPVTMAYGTLVAVITSNVSGEEYILSGTYMCYYNYDGAPLPMSIPWALYIVWEVIILCLAVWVAVKHFREWPLVWTTADSFAVLIRVPMVYFLISIAVSSLSIGYFSPDIYDSSSAGSQVYYGVFEILFFVQMFVLGPHLILSVRKYYAKLVVKSDAGPYLTAMAFQEHTHVSTSSTSGV